jgi:hypothetical protein
VSEGEISDLHIGRRGAMNALYLKDLADKTRRGLEGRVRAVRSGGGLCYGYDVVPGEERGGRTINEDEAAIVRRIFTEFAAGRSPKVIARRLNDDGIPGPRGILWSDTAIRGHRQRGTGLLNNALYIGRLGLMDARSVRSERAVAVSPGYVGAPQPPPPDTGLERYASQPDARRRGTPAQRQARLPGQGWGCARPSLIRGLPAKA